MSQRTAHMGKILLFFSLALLTGLLITRLMLQAHASEKPVLSIGQLATERALQLEDGDLQRDLLEEKVRRADQERTMITLASREFKLMAREAGTEGSPEALLAIGKVRGVDDRGRLIELSAAGNGYDLPVLTGSGLRFNPETKRVDGFLFHRAMEFIEEVNGRSELLGAQLSEVNCDPELGLVAYFSQTGALPVLIGSHGLEEKAKNLDIFFEQLGPSTLMGKIRCLDARQTSQIVIKKSKP